jgi:hypothetical protein
MPALPHSITLLTNSVSQLLTLGGVELSGSRRYLDFEGITTVRAQFRGALSVRIEYSLDFGDTWATLIPDEQYRGTDPYIGSWQAVPDEIGNWGDVMLRCLGIGSGLLVGVDYVEMQYR